jgi:RNA polymerase sigma factor (sigma-70 family)
VSATRTFEALVLPHLDAGYNLARWLLRDEAMADDVMQEACLRAYRHLASLRGDNARPWFLQIVRHACYTALHDLQGLRELSGLGEDELETLQVAAGHAAPDPAAALNRRREHAAVDEAIRALSPPLREVIVLRELEGLDYADIALVASIPIGTVMSRLSRARTRLRAMLTQQGVGD